MSPNRRPQDVIDRIVACRGKLTSGELAKEYGITRNAVIGIWNRAKGTPGFQKMASHRFVKGDKRLKAPTTALVEEVAPEPVIVEVIAVEPAVLPEPVVEVLAPIEPKPQEVRPVPLFVGDHDQVRFTGAAAAIEAFDGGCRWPHGDPREAGFFFCGEPIEKVGRPYCTEHHALAWGGRPESRHPCSYRPMRSTGKEHAI